MILSNITETISEAGLKRRIGGIFSDSPEANLPRYAEHGFYPVEYDTALSFQTHDMTSAYIENGKVIITASDLPLEQILPQAREMINEIRKGREFTYILVNLGNKTIPFSMSETSQYNLAEAVNETEDIEWIMADGTVEKLTNDDLNTVRSAVKNRKKDLFSLQTGYSKQLDSCTTADEVRTLLAQAQTDFDNI